MGKGKFFHLGKSKLRFKCSVKNYKVSTNKLSVSFKLFVSLLPAKGNKNLKIKVVQ
ncbi:hypothetical protein BSPA14S_J0013 (plasmid) [Borreliella spielmanii A14S]|uniref:Uncharacterized protein n=1 Tax=Borreliella spielmanii A14S TaxID=498742 RepID=C0RBK5_9SPIR|nr:hypothetical protein BSPA14S_J0013 [Borreliella spielmanii A14S]